MLTIQGLAKTDVSCTVEVDEYVPLSVKTYSEVLPGAKYYRIGNFGTSLLEIGIDPASLLIRAVCVVLFDKIGHANDLRCVVAQSSEEIGLPVVSASCLKDGYTDEKIEFRVGLDGNSFVIDWREGKTPNRSIRYQNLEFFVSDEEICAIAIRNLSDAQVRTLEEHLSAVAG
jgi:hypothetical protein